MFKWTLDLFKWTFGLLEVLFWLALYWLTYPIADLIPYTHTHCLLRYMIAVEGK